LTDDGLALSDPRPGVAGRKNAFDVRCANVGETVYYAYGFRVGTTLVPGCPGASVEIKNAALAGSAVAQVDGFARLVLFVPPVLSGRVLHLQAVEFETCRLSARVRYRFR